MFSLLVEFNSLTLSDSGDGDTLGPLPGQGGNWGSSDGEFPVAPYEYFQNSSRGPNSTSSKSPSPGKLHSDILAVLVRSFCGNPTMYKLLEQITTFSVIIRDTLYDKY